MKKSQPRQRKLRKAETRKTRLSYNHVSQNTPELTPQTLAEELETIKQNDNNKHYNNADIVVPKNTNKAK